MRTSPDRFSSYVGLCRLANGETRRVLNYSYESKAALYDVKIITGAAELQFFKNMRPAPREPHHDVIMKHFKIEMPAVMRPSELAGAL